MRRAGLDVLPVAARLAARHRSPASAARSRCRCAISRPAASLDILVDVARGYDGQDRSYLEALGTGATGKEAGALRSAAARARRRRRSARVVADLRADRVAAARARGGRRTCTARAQSSKLSPADRRLALDTLAFIDGSGRLEGDAQPRQRRTAPLTRAGDVVAAEPHVRTTGPSYGLRPALKAAGIYDPDAITLREVVVPRPPADLPELSVDEIVAAHRRCRARQGRRRRAA